MKLSDIASSQTAPDTPPPMKLSDIAKPTPTAPVKLSQVAGGTPAPDATKTPPAASDGPQPPVYNAQGKVVPFPTTKPEPTMWDKIVGDLKEGYGGKPPSANPVANIMPTISGGIGAAADLVGGKKLKGDVLGYLEGPGGLEMGMPMEAGAGKTAEKAMPKEPPSMKGPPDEPPGPSGSAPKMPITAESAAAEIGKTPLKGTTNVTVDGKAATLQDGKPVEQPKSTIDDNKQPTKPVKLSEVGKPQEAPPVAPEMQSPALPGVEHGALTHPPALGEPRKFEDQLYQLQNLKTDDKIEAMKRLEALPKEAATPEMAEKLYHYEENPKGEPLTPEEQKIYDEHAKPIKDEANALAARLEHYGWPEGKAEDAEAHTPRYVAGRTRSLGEALSQWMKGVQAKFGGAPGRTMRKTVDAQKGRRFFKAVNSETGDTATVYVAPDGKIFRFDEGTKGQRFDLGEWGKLPPNTKRTAGSKFTTKGLGQWTIEDATTKEIERDTEVRYNKNLWANRLDNLMKLRSAVRNAEYLEAMKKHPDWSNVAVEVNKVNSPPVDEVTGREYRIANMPQFRNYYLKPELADALDDLKGDHYEEGMDTALKKISHISNVAMFWNPTAHLKNVANHYWVSKGLVGNVIHAPKTVKTLIQAAKEVATVGPKYRELLRSGASLPYTKYMTRDLHKSLFEKLGGDAQANPGEWDKIAKVAGYANPKELLSRVWNATQTALWAPADVMTMARMLEEEAKGKSVEEAIRNTERHMPNYRVPGQVLGNRFAAQVMKNPFVGRFGRYQYNRLASYMNMAKDLVSNGVPLKDRAHALDQMAMIGFFLYLFYPEMDKAWQAATGNPNAKVTRPGATSVPEATLGLINGDKDYGGFMSSLFTMGVPLEMANEVHSGRYGWSGQPIANASDLRSGDPTREEQFAVDALDYAGSKLNALQQGTKLLEGKSDAMQSLLSQIGVSTPTPKQIQQREYWKHEDDKVAAKRANKQKETRGW